MAILVLFGNARGLTKVEAVDGYQHNQIDQRKEDENPEPNCTYEVWHNLINDATSNRKRDCGKSDPLCTRSERKYFRRVDPT
jgi:hypothetical protein